MNTQRRFRGITILLIVAAVVLISCGGGQPARAGDISYGEMRSYFVQEKVKSFTASDERLTAVLQDDSAATCALQSFDTFYSDLNDLVVEQADKGIITSYNYTPGNTTNWLSTLLPYVLAVMAFILLMNLIARTGGGGAVNDKMARFGEARIQDIPDDGKKVTFKDVAGADEEKEELEEIVQFLRDPGKYTELGAQILAGVLLVRLRAPKARRCWPRPWRARPTPRSCPSPAPILWRCMWAWAPAASATCSSRPRSSPRPSCSSTRSTRWDGSAAAVWAAAMTSASRR